ncbi:MAG: dihydrolipoamide acetyltransferase family protein [Gemmatimonadales bacterium]
MATNVLMEALSPTMEEGRLVEWKKQEGEAVAAGDVLAEVETDKAVMDLVARASGVMLKHLVPAGTTLAVGKTVGVIGKVGEEVAVPAVETRSAAPAAAPPPASVPAKAPLATVPPAPNAPPVASSPAPAVAADGTAGRIKASPLAKKIAADRGLNLAGIHGSGPEGRVVARDLDQAAASAAPPATTSRSAVAETASFTDVPLSLLRKTIAKRLAQSIGPVPTFYLTSEIDMERVWEAREALNTASANEKSESGKPSKISINDIVIKAVAAALRQHPACNAWWQEDRIRYWADVHVSMAVAIEDGLITPVIRHADQKSLREISAESRELAGRARERRLAPEEYTGGTFSVSNLGMFEIDQFTAVINPPEAGILAVGGTVQKPVVVDGQVVVRRRMRVTLSCDHRIIDGATGAAFLKTLKLMLENPLALVW